jgi:nucleotide-binding universal stress UspA family protein
MKTILAYLEGTDRDRTVLAAAAAVGRSSGGPITALRVHPDPLSLIGYLHGYSMAPAPAIGEAVHGAQREVERRTARSAAEFESFCATNDIARPDTPTKAGALSASWDRRDGDALALLTHEARFRDLVVLAGGPRENLSFTVEDLGSLLIDIGRPLLLTPPGHRGTDFRRIGIAWKNKPEAARALTAAMPLLELAKEVMLLGAAEGSQTKGELEASLAALAAQLRWHGVVANPQTLEGDRKVADALLTTASSLELDLLVMGGYGHSRVREVVFGGVTERVLRGVTVPVLMAH